MIDLQFQSATKRCGNLHVRGQAVQVSPAFYASAILSFFTVFTPRFILHRSNASDSRRRRHQYVLSPSFTVLAWLTPDPRRIPVQVWTDRGLPTMCYVSRGAKLIKLKVSSCTPFRVHADVAQPSLTVTANMQVELAEKMNVNPHELRYVLPMNRAPNPAAS